MQQAGYAIPFDRYPVGQSSAATLDQLKAINKSLTEQFFNLVQAARFRIAIARKYGLDSPAFKSYNAKYVPWVNKWMVKELKYEREALKKGIKGIIASGQLDMTGKDFYYSASLPKLDALVKKFDAERSTNGIGWVALVVWGIIGLVGLFTTQEVVDDLTTTAQEKEQLLKTTAETAAQLGLTPEQAQQLISQTQAEASGGGFTDIIMWGALGLIAVAVVPNLIKSKSN